MTAIRLTGLATVALAWLAGCQTPQEMAPALEDLAPIASGIDYHSFANSDQARVTHLDLDLTVDFGRRVVGGSARLDISVAPGARELVLDTRDLDIERVDLVVAHKRSPAAFKMGDNDPVLGTPLRISLSNAPPSSMSVEIHYASRPEASGLQWLTPPQTAGKKHPFLFTQSQAIHARSWIPLQDSPAVRMTYRATIRTRKGLLAVMSAANEFDTPRDGEYHFEMPQAIPSYLIALAVGDLDFQAMSKRTGVYAEPSLLHAAATEFADTETMLQISEELYGPYRWGRYDLLILPPSFPFGGMENPRLSFITPTVIAGDKSLVALIAHELAHSWSGNLVTNATWRDLWLNEGFTSFLTARIMEAVYSPRRATIEYYLDFQGLEADIADLPDSDEILAVDMRGRDPDEVFSDVPYVKGQLFLSWLESRFGRDHFDLFLREYFDRHAFQSITTDQFLVYLKDELIAPNPGVVTQQELDEWIFAPGIPATAVIPYSNAFSVIDEQSFGWLSGSLALTDIETDAWSVHEWLYFLNNLPKSLSATQLADLDATYGLTETHNNEIAHSWLLHVIRNDYRPGFDRLEKYLVEIGRRKLIVPLYETLMESDSTRDFAARVYQRARAGYHPLAISTIDKIVIDPEG